MPTPIQRPGTTSAVTMFAACFLIEVAGCSGGGISRVVTPIDIGPTSANAQTVHASGKISHIVIIIQENRTPDNLFYGLRGADVLSSGMTAAPMAGVNDMSHAHDAFVADFDGGKLDGFAPATKTYVQRSDAQPYFELARDYTFADRMFQSNEGPSYPAHQYLVSGTSTIAQGSNMRVAENPAGNGFSGPFNEGGCDSTPTVLVKLIDEHGNENRSVFPCFERPALTDLLDAKGLSWRYYQANLGAGLWNGLDSIKHVQRSAEFATNVVAPSARVLSDVADGKLAAVTWITPTARASDHPSITDGTGPDWVVSVVNEIGKSKYWDSTAIIVTWDDWGGWYDHVAPPQYNSYELGFRVPLLVISPYAKRGYVSHIPYEFGSILKFVENTFDLGTLDTTDARAQLLSDCFDFRTAPRAYRPIPTRRAAAYFLAQPASNASPDND